MAFAFKIKIKGEQFHLNWIQQTCEHVSGNVYVSDCFLE